ncbi:MAG: hypothetical protein WCD89_06830 [Anaerocolumna sp.]
MRLLNTLRNTVWNLIGQVILIFSGLFLKQVLIHTVGTENIGLNYLFNDIVSLLSVAELGLTGIIAYHLYEPLSKGNQIKVIQVMAFFKKAYAVIGLFVTLLGFGIMPFLSYLVGDTTLDYQYIAIIFVLFLFRSVEGYFFSYNQILLYADQKAYIITIVDIITSLFYTLISIVVLQYTRSFIYVILIEIIKKIINDFIIFNIVNKRYPYIKKNKLVSLDRAEVVIIGTDVKNAFVSRASSGIVGATDNVIISMFLGISVTGLYSNYSMVFNTLQNVLYLLIQSVQASVGNLLVEAKGGIVYSVFRKITFVSFFMVSICGCCLIQLSTPFVALWFGKDYVMNDIIVWVCVFNIYIFIMQLVIVQFAGAGGLFKQSKKIDLIGCIINVFLSVFFVKITGIIGVFLATFISIVIEYVFRIRMIFKEILKVNGTDYVLHLVGYFLCFIVEIVTVKVIACCIDTGNPILNFTIWGFISIFVPLLINIGLYHSSDDFQYMLFIIKMFFKRKLEDNI